MCVCEVGGIRYEFACLTAGAECFRLCLTVVWPEAGVVHAVQCVCVRADFKLAIFNSLTPESGRVPPFYVIVLFLKDPISCSDRTAM